MLSLQDYSGQSKWLALLSMSGFVLQGREDHINIVVSCHIKRAEHLTRSDGLKYSKRNQI